MQNDLILEQTAQIEPSARPDLTLAVTRGVCRLFGDLGMAVLPEFRLPNGRRADVTGLTAKGQLMIAEVKSCREDFVCDDKWSQYRGYCDFFFLAVSPAFPTEILPADEGRIVADQFGGAILIRARESRLAPSRRKTLTLSFARQAASRLAQAGR